MYNSKSGIRIYVFKTSVENPGEVERLRPSLNNTLKLARWSFDLEDCDHILRIETTTEPPEAIIKLLKDEGFDCEELSY